MPVIDHDVHPSTMKGPDFRYGCWNRKPFEKGYYAPNRFMPKVMQDLIALCFRWGAQFIPHRMSLDCRYDMSLTDCACHDCKHRGSGESYAQSIREQGA